MKKSFKAFTLAEILVTLVVVGVVASLTIPSIYSSKAEKEYTNAFKKSVAILDTAIADTISEDGLTMADFQAGTADFIELFVKKRLKARKINKVNQNIIFKTPDGVSYNFVNIANCAGLEAVPLVDIRADINTYSTNACYKVSIDINGEDKGKNINPSRNGSNINIGDVFMVYVFPKGIAMGSIESEIFYEQ